MLPKFPPGFSHPMRIGAGAFASVYRVRQTALERWVALKFVFEKNVHRRHELLGEAQTQARLHAQCVPQIYDAFEWRQSVCMVMEWVRGVSLAELLTTELSPDDRLRLAGSCIRALAEIHERGFAHRDLKPENVLVAPDHGIYLVDFGFSKDIADVQRSSATVAKGTPAYMAPELWSMGGQVDLMRADVYAAGKVLVQILEGTSHEDFTALLLAANPLKRPASGVALKALWEQENGLIAEPADWLRIAGNLVAARMSDTLLTAARQLRYAHRGEEAYWLLVESIEENGNNGEAVDMMAAFQSVPGKKKTIVQYTLFALILLIGVISAFIAGSGINRHHHVEGPGLLRQQLPKLSPLSAVSAPALKVTLREDPMRTDRLSGRLLLSSLPPGMQLAVGDRIIPADSALTYGVYLHRGEHLISLRDSTGRIVRQETVRLLPFQTKVIAVAFAGETAKGTRP